MLIIGDIHGRYNTYLHLLKLKADNFEKPTLQLGDFGMGFSAVQDFALEEILTDKDKEHSLHKFFRGNHDSPQRCNESPLYLGDWGQHENGIFYVGGGLSIDRYCPSHRHLARTSAEPPADCQEKARKLAREIGQDVPCCRVTGRDFWNDEQLSHDELGEVIAAYEKAKPEIVITHECPYELIDPYVGAPFLANMAAAYGRSRTSMALQAMYDAHQPKIWIFGHYHVRKAIETGKTRFEALDMLRDSSVAGWADSCTIELPDLTW